jgi:hypothetical protein
MKEWDVENVGRVKCELLTIIYWDTRQLPERINL